MEGNKYEKPNDSEDEDYNYDMNLFRLNNKDLQA